MPVYVYKCKQCGYEFEDMQSMDKQYETNCPNCGPKCTGKENLEIIPQVTNFQIK